MRKFFTGLIIVLVLVSLAGDFGYYWIKKNAYKHPTVQTTNFSTLKDTNVKTYIFEMTYYANSDNSGVEMFEIKLNCYTGINKNKIHSYGVQLVNPKNIKNTFNVVKTEGVGFIGLGGTNQYWKYNYDYSNCELTYFNSDDATSYNATVALNERKTPYIVDIGGQLYAFTFNAKSFMRLDRSWISWKYYQYLQSDFDYFLNTMYSSMSNITTGTGVYENLNINVDNVFVIYSYNETTKKFDIQTELGYSAEYMGVRIKYVERGARVHEDSMFNKIGSSTKGGVIYG